MTKREVARTIADGSDLSGTPAAAVLVAVAAELAAGRDAALAGFGRSSVTEHAARERRNPATGDAVQLPASRAPQVLGGCALESAPRLGDASTSWRGDQRRPRTTKTRCDCTG
jgi:DNA-binding protein HU-beta